ncbi:class IV adenylate cyclase [Candidatus Woesearchaeota archaeon]|nr:class IV adenylate cyclase [Candidatus Woesearchaeota archaeon]
MEIEIRAKIEDREKVKQILVEKGMEIKYEEDQVDYYYKPKGKEKEPQGPGSAILRIRKTVNGNFLTYKALTNQKGAWIEHDIQISDVGEMGNILDKVGYVNVLTIHKSRIAGTLGNKGINIDLIKELGEYIECEIHSEDVADAKAQILALLKELEIPETNIEHKGYARILFEKQGVKYIDGDDEDESE